MTVYQSIRREIRKGDKANARLLLTTVVMFCIGAAFEYGYFDARFKSLQRQLNNSSTAATINWQLQNDEWNSNNRLWIETVRCLRTYASNEDAAKCIRDSA